MELDGARGQEQQGADLRVGQAAPARPGGFAEITDEDTFTGAPVWARAQEVDCAGTLLNRAFCA